MVHEVGGEVDGPMISSLLKHPWDKEKWVISNLVAMKIPLPTDLPGAPHFKKGRQSFLAGRLRSKQAVANRPWMEH